jgi:hypothetical protein
MGLQGKSVKWGLDKILVTAQLKNCIPSAAFVGSKPLSQRVNRCATPIPKQSQARHFLQKVLDSTP